MDSLFLACGHTDLQPGDAVMLHVETTLAGIPMQGRVVRRCEAGIGIELAHPYLHFTHDVLTALAREGRIFTVDGSATADTA